MTRVCPRCSTPHPDDVHWCECNQFLGFEPTVETTNGNGHATAATAVLPRVAPPKEGPVVELHVPGATDPAAGAPVLRVAAGGTTSLVASVRNQTRIVEGYDVVVEDLPRGWWSVAPGTTGLLPFDARDHYDAEVVVTIHPPRTPAAEARSWPFRVVATAVSRRELSDSAPAAVEIEPFAELAADARPEIALGRRQGQLTAHVRNRGNAPAPLVAAGVDPQERCDVLVPLEPEVVAPGRAGVIPVTVVARKRHWFGRPVDHRLVLGAHVTGDELVAAPAFSAVFRQRPVVPWWVALLVLLLAIAILLLFLLWPSHATVPDVRGSRSAFEAQKYLEDEGLRLDPQIRTLARRRGTRPGTVVDQTPAPGTEVPEGKAVTVLVAGGARRAEVPDLKGMTAPEADQALQDAGLSLGEVTPELDGKGTVAEQVPAAGAKRKSGTPVAVVLAPPEAEPVDKPKKKNGAGKEKAVPKGAAPGATAEQAVAALEKAKLTPVVEKQVALAKEGKVLATKPAEGEPPPEDGKVVLTVSAGFPRLLYDNGRNALVADGRNGGGKVRVGTGGAAVASGGGWSPDGRLVAFTQRGKLYVEPPGSKGKGRDRIAVGSGRTPMHPTFAPKGRTVLAFVDRSGATQGDAVCWTERLPKRWSRPSCRRFRSWQIDGITWEPLEGRTILLSAMRQADEFGLLRIGSDTPFSAKASDWRKGGAAIVTPRDPGGGVRSAVYSPDGKRLAFVSNLDTPDFRVGIAAADDVKLEDSRTLHWVPGCDVAWRSDGAELAVVQSGATCTRRIGRIVRVKPERQQTVVTLVLSGQHPSWEPL